MNALLRRWRYAWLLVLALGISSCASLTPHSEQSGLLWQISRPGYQPGFLFGTIHSEDTRVISILDNVYPSLNQSELFLMEVAMTPEAIKFAANAMYYRNGKTLEKTIGDDLYQRSVRALAKKGFQEDYVRYFKPWSVFTVLSMPPPETGEFMDVRLQHAAEQAGKKTDGLETMQDQIAVFDDMTEQQQIALLRDTLDHLDEMDGLLDDTINAYLSRDLANLEALNQQYLMLLDEKLRTTFLDRLLYQRNKNMLRTLLPLLKQQRTFVAVGALHLSGERGLVALLRQQGFSVTPVY